MKLFLASSLDKTLPLLKSLAPHDPTTTRVAYIENAADPYKEQDPEYTNTVKETFKEIGYQLNEIDLRTITADELSRILKNTDILHVCGGSVFYLVGLIKNRGFESILIDAIKNDPLIYTGSSAGSIIISSSLAPFAFDEAERDFLASVPDQKGLSLINFGIMPHANNSDFAQEFNKVVEQLPIHPEPLLFIQDHQAVWVTDDMHKIVSI